MSGFNDKGYTLVCSTSSPIYDQSNVQYTSTFTVPSSDIYANTTGPGIFVQTLINFVSIYLVPVLSSTINTVYISEQFPTNSEIAFFVFPGYGFQLFSENSYGGTATRLYYNTSTGPLTFGTNNSYNCIIYTTSGSAWSDMGANSIKIFYRGTQINTGLAPYE